MKATTTVKMAVLAVAVSALVAAPAFAFAYQPPVGQHLIDPSIHQMEHVDLVEPPAIEYHKALGEIGFVEAVEEDDSTLGEPPVMEAAGDPVDPTHAPDGPTIMVPRTPDTTPTVPTTPRVPRRPYLPHTGGDSLGWILAGVAVVALGIALAAWGTGTRRADVR